MKTTALLTAIQFIFSLGFPIRVEAQRIFPEKEVLMLNLGTERELKINRFTIKTCDSTVYLQWTTHNEKEEGIFLVMRSQNQQDFKIIAVKEDLATDAMISLLYGFVDKKPTGGISYYRILKVYKDNSFYYSDIEDVEVEKLYPGEQKSAGQPNI